MPGPCRDYPRRLVADERKLGELFDGGDLFKRAAVAVACVLDCGTYTVVDLLLGLLLAMLFACLLEETGISLIRPSFYSSSCAHDFDSSISEVALTST